MRQPLVTMTRIASALIQCVTRTTRGWIFIESVGTGSIASPWSEDIAYTLQRASTLPFAKPLERPGEAAPERDDLEQLAHLRRAHQPVRLVRERQESRAVLRGRTGHHVGDAAVDEELRLAGVAR